VNHEPGEPDVNRESDQPNVNRSNRRLVKLLLICASSLYLVKSSLQETSHSMLHAGSCTASILPWNSYCTALHCCLCMIKSCLQETPPGMLHAGSCTAGCARDCTSVAALPCHSPRNLFLSGPYLQPRNNTTTTRYVTQLVNEV
jgi:hypothetical protein